MCQHVVTIRIWVLSTNEAVTELATQKRRFEYHHRPAPGAPHPKVYMSKSEAISEERAESHPGAADALSFRTHQEFNESAALITAASLRIHRSCKEKQELHPLGKRCNRSLFHVARVCV